MRIAGLYHQFELVQKFQACDNISSKVAFLTNKRQTFQTILVFLHLDEARYQKKIILLKLEYLIVLIPLYVFCQFYIFLEQDEDHEEKCKMSELLNY